MLHIDLNPGAGGRGGASRTDAVDHFAAKAFASASVHTPIVTRFIMVSYPGSRRTRPSWWSDEAWKRMQDANNGVLANYSKAKIAVDEYLTAISTTRSDFSAICLRPGTLSEAKAGPVALGKIDIRTTVSREGVAEVAAKLLDNADKWKPAKCTWLDMLDGDEDVAKAVDRCLSEEVDTLEGEDQEMMKREAELS